MVAKNLTKYLDDKDKYGEKIKDWAEQVGQGEFKCRICLPEKVLSFKQGRSELFKHSESDKHRKALSSLKSSTQTQPTLVDFITVDDDDSKKAKEFEIAIIAMLARHDIPVTFVDCLVPTLKKHINDSKILDKVVLARQKASYLVTHGLGDHYEKETVNKLKNCFAFSASIDESEVNKRNELEVVVKLASRSGIETRHYNCIDLDGSDAQSIVDSLLDCFIEDSIDFKSKCINVATDGCATMIGNRKGVITKLSDEIPQLHYTGSCNGHNLNNSMQKGVESFDPDMTKALVDLYEELGGSKGKGLKKMHEFQESCLARGHNPKPFKKFINVRFRSIRTAIEPVIYNFDELVHFFKVMKKNKKKPTDRDCRLIAYFVDREDLTRLKLKFVFAATASMTEKIDIFEKNQANIHNAANIIENIYVDQLHCIIDDSELSVIDSENDELRKKSRSELLTIDVNAAKVLHNKHIFIGHECAKEIKSLGLSPDSKQLSWFMDIVKKFHFSVIKSLQKYFQAPLQSTVMDCFSALCQSKQSHVLTVNKLKTLANKFSKVIENIDAVDGMDKIKREIQRYQTDEDIRLLDKLSYEDFWLKVASLTDGSDSWSRYEVLPYFAISMGVRFISNSEVERMFSLMNNIHSNKHRNAMSQDSLNSYLHIRTGVECKEIRSECKECTISNKLHCHCSLLEIDVNLRESCKKAGTKYKESLKENSFDKAASSDAMLAKKAKVDEEIKKSVAQRKEKLAKSANFCNPSLFESVYNPMKNKKDKNSNVVLSKNTPSSSKSFKLNVDKRKGDSQDKSTFKAPRYDSK